MRPGKQNMSLSCPSALVRSRANDPHAAVLQVRTSVQVTPVLRRGVSLVSTAATAGRVEVTDAIDRRQFVLLLAQRSTERDG